MTHPNHLIIFTRYPIPGTTKTRLIPALGAAGAAALQKQLTEHTLEQVSGLTADVTIYFSGGGLLQMQAWLGEHWRFKLQRGKGLGDRLIHSIQQSKKNDYQRTVVIGIDCPEITAEILEEAFVALEQHDVVLGEATDGGYYLIGLQQLIPELFQDMAWGIDTVLTETLRRTAKLNLSTKILRPLNDIDYPEDLAIWEKVKAAKVTSTAE
ncbi:TIGR04282 family arsenosugar biosynthesis glycosyltransferase [[Limnothrix rosea] IAM M-220]|uniref:TIGR04282 family arsenosugar biosynthesis glycosyltransferase n=1 Tax=[Limnothrix rosea] IAM M-220 TaxID=454133 RepID=UPI00096748A3|nr:TIGR04282 family arsenosugar biosynthesis glycosyltransferase [[Limnothrix rosea] IAM M-220]OKH17084.1 hypothetical protein NIES208_10865 [[Limnothrix rosea] IAM M-220]